MAQRRCFAALDVLEGNVIGRCMQRHRHQEFTRFLNAIEGQVPARKTVHVILDNYAAHKHPKVSQWLARHRASPSTSHRPRARGSMQSKGSSPNLPSSGSSAVSSGASSILQAAINRFVAKNNRDPKPFTWTADPDKTIAAVRRGHRVLDTIH